MIGCNLLDRLYMTFFLASGSPRRRELFALFGWPFEVISAEVDESPHDGETPVEMVLRLAQAKALATSRVTSDGIVMIDGQFNQAPSGKQKNQSGC